MYQLTEALLYLKSVAVAHRDVKPSNISFSSEGELKLIDFDEAICFK
jgi:serine/threonine protein kinase